MRLEARKYYRTKDGTVHGPMRIMKQFPDRFTDERGNWYDASGHYWAQRPGAFSLIEEVALTKEKRP